MIERKKIIGVMGSHENEWTEYAVPLGEMIAQRGYHLLTGCGAGVMSEVSRGFSMVKGRKGVAIGLRPIEQYSKDAITAHEFPNAYIDVPITTILSHEAQNDMMPYSRNMVNIMSSDALVALPGAHGTKNEASLGLMYDKPVILFGPDGEFDTFPQDTVYTDNIKGIEHFFMDVFGGHKYEQ